MSELVYEEFNHEADKLSFGAWFCRADGKWYWFDRNWAEKGPYDSEAKAEYDRVRHPDFAVYAEEIE